MRKRHFPGSGLLFDLRRHGVEDHADSSPALDLREYLSGPLAGSGVFLGFSGGMDRQFTMDMVGRWSGNTGTLDERFRYSDGLTGERCWELAFADGENFTATAHDVEGVATGVQRGNSAVMRYRLRIGRESGEIVVAMEDWFHLMADATLINRARMAKFGFKVGELCGSFRRREIGEAATTGMKPS